MDIRSESFLFPNSKGQNLDSRLEYPESSPSACAIFAHCFTCSKTSVAAYHISKQLARKGIAVLRFDFTGLGASKGEFSDTNFSSNVQDLLAAMDHLSKVIAPPSLLVGHSLGGTACLAAALQSPYVKAVATIGSPAEPAHVARLISPVERKAIQNQPEVTVQIDGRPFRIRKQFLDDIQQYKLLEKIPQLNKALLVMHAPGDDTVPIDNATRIFMLARHPKSFCSLDSADHLLTRSQDAQWVADIIAAWAGRFIKTSYQAS